MGDYTLHNEQLVLQQVALGDEQAFAKVFDHYRPNIYTTALRITGDPMTAEEILQDVFLKVWMKRTILHEVQHFGGWLYTIAEHLTFNALKRLQRERKKQQQLSRETVSLPTQTDNLLLEKEYTRILHEAIQRLPDKQRQTYILIKQQGLKREEAASILQVSPETVKGNLQQAMHSIRAFCLSHLDPMILMLLINRLW